MPSSRRTIWVDTFVALNIANSAQGFQSLRTGTGSAEIREATIVRTIYQLNLWSATVAGAFGVQEVFLGWGVATQEAFAAGVLSDPNTAGDRPVRGWMFRTTCHVSQNGVGTPIVHPCMGDSKSMRKIDSGEPFIIANNESVTGTSFNVNIRGIIRQLYLLP